LTIPRAFGKARSMTVQEIVLDLLAYANIYGFSLGGADNGEDESEIVRAVGAVNQSIQIIYRDGPESLKYGSRSAYINPTTNITLTTTQGQKTATMVGQFAEWMRGCSALIGGEQMLNRIVDITYNGNDAPAPTSTFTFLRALTGASGTPQATIYGDCFLMDADVAAVLEPVTLARTWRLRPAQSKVDFLSTYYWSCPISGRRCCYYPFYTLWEKVTGVPQEFRVEALQDSARTGTSIYLSINPMPLAPANLTFEVYRKPILITRADLDEQGGDDPEAEVKALDPDMVESYLLPIARWKYVAAHPNVQNREVRGSLKTVYDEAYMRLKNGASLNPQQTLTRARYI
jgi:hypothetical protein